MVYIDNDGKAHDDMKRLADEIKANNDPKVMLQPVSIFGQTIKLWGVAAQLRKANEELGELIVAMSHYFWEGRITKDDIAEEIADVEIVCAQLRYLVGNERVNDWKIKKLKRLRKRVDDAKKASSD